MKKMMNRMLSLQNKVMMSAIAFLGFSSCDTPGKEEPLVEYGCPNAIYEVKGMVTDAKGSPIPGIQVRMGEVREYDEAATALTDVQGKFMVSAHGMPTDTIAVTATDVDGEQNGSFEERTVKVGFGKDDQTEKGSGWYDGKYSKEVNLKLEEKP